MAMTLLQLTLLVSVFLIVFAPFIVLPIALYLDKDLGVTFIPVVAGFGLIILTGLVVTLWVIVAKFIELLGQIF